jgi:hypothetical protein
MTQLGGRTNASMTTSGYWYLVTSQVTNPYQGVIHLYADNNTFHTQIYVNATNVANNAQLRVYREDTGVQNNVVHGIQTAIWQMPTTGAVAIFICTPDDSDATNMYGFWETSNGSASLWQQAGVFSSNPTGTGGGTKVYDSQSDGNCYPGGSHMNTIYSTLDCNGQYIAALTCRGGISSSKKIYAVDTITSSTNVGADNSTGGAFIGQFLASTLATSSDTNIGLGTALSSYNSGLLKFYNAGTGSTSNYMDAEIYGYAGQLRLKGDGTVSLSSNTPSYTYATGSLVTAGGLGVANNVVAGGSLFAAGSYPYMDSPRYFEMAPGSGAFFMETGNVLHNDGGNYSKTFTGTGTPTYSGLKLVLPADAYVSYVIASSVDFGQTGCIRLLYTPGYSTKPATVDANFATFGTYGQPNSMWFLHGVNAGEMGINCYDSSGTIKNTWFNIWNTCVSGTEYEIEFAWNWTTGAHYCFVNGVSLGSLDTTTMTRSSVTNLTLGTPYNQTSYRQLTIWGGAIHTATYLTQIPITMYDDYMLLPTAGGTATRFDYYEEYSLSSAFSQAWTSGNMTGKIIRVGKLVTLVVDERTAAISTTSNQIAAAGAIPSRFRPTQAMQMMVPIVVENNTSEAGGWVCAFTNGDIVVSRSLTTSFTTGTIGYYGFSISWVVT